jgi:hypothetical protein
MSIFMYMCMKYVAVQAHVVYEMYNKNIIFTMLINGILVSNNTHDKLCITPFAKYFTPDG